MIQSIIAQGAEAIIIKEKNTIIKDRKRKSYRLSVLDEKIRKQRTKKEIKLLQKAFNLILVPKIIKSDNYNIKLEFIKGKRLSEYLDNLPNYEEVYIQIGQNIAKLHDAGIIHGDLTTSNMIYSKKKVYFIDFGLGFESSHAEDKATDLHVLKEALESRHFKNADKLWKAILCGYKISKYYAETIKKLEAVEKRGRYKQSY